MSESFYDELEGLIGKHREKEASDKQSEENEARFKRLEDRFDAIGNLIDERLPAKTPAAANSEASAGGGENKPVGEEANSPPTKPKEEPAEELNVERIKKFTVPRIYTGDDEPSIVRYIDADTGEELTRKGRQKNKPTNYDVDIVMPEPVERPQEPSEEVA